MNQDKKNLSKKLKLLTDTRVLSLLAFGVVALLVTWSGVKVVQTNYELDKKISVSKQKNEVARLENENLKLKNAYYQSPQFLDLAARRQFGKALPGERLYMVPESVALSKTIDVPADQRLVVKTEKVKPKAQQNFQAWIEFLF
jgi:cell division protein FtsB